MEPKPFVGRKHELDKLLSLHSRATPSLVVIKGRRRIGKSRLAAEFASKLPQQTLWNFAGLAPQASMTAQTQRDHFARQLASNLKLPPYSFQDWSDAFEHLSLHVQAGDIILLDEISWMGAKDPGFVPKLKAWWDMQTIPLTVIFCGSVSTWIDANILSSTAFFGRINLTLTLEPLSIPASAKLLKAMGYQGSAYDTFKLLSVFGGIPWYLEQVMPGQMANDIIKRLCFEKESMLALEFDRIFHDLFNGKSTVYRAILETLNEGMKTLAEIREAINVSHSGTLSKLMENLIVAGFVKKQPLWSFKTKKPLKQSLYHICDPYMRFYLKVIEPQQAKIELGAFETAPLSSLPGFEAHMSLQLEYLLLQNRSILLKMIGIDLTDVVFDGSYRQSQTTKAAGCQIDYLIQTTTNNLFVCEFKFKRREIGTDIVPAMQSKIQALKVPRGYAAVPVLFHIGGVAASVETKGYFYRIIDISDLLIA